MKRENLDPRNIYHDTKTGIHAYAGETIGQGKSSNVIPGWRDSESDEYAVKVLRLPIRENMSEEEVALKRSFQKEISVHGQLQHKNVVPFQGSGSFHMPDMNANVLYLAMSRANHGSLITRRVDQRSSQIKRFSLEDTVDILCQGAEGLQYVHNQGIIDNDVKPDNLLLHNLDGRLTVWLSDFGSTGVLSGTALRQFGELGTMAPEKFQEGAVSNKEGDIYAYGLVAYEVLTGERPTAPSEEYDPNIDGETTYLAWKRFHEQGQTLQRFPDRWDVARFPDPEMIPIRAALQEPVLKAIAKDPADRHGSAGDFAEDLRTHFERAVALQKKNPKIVTESGKVVYDDPLSRKADKEREAARSRLDSFTFPVRQPNTSGSETSRVTPRKAPDFLDQTGKNKKEAVKPSQKKKAGSIIDRRTLLKAGAGVVAAGAVWYLVESLNNGLSESESSPQDKLMNLAKEGITYFQEQGDIGSAGEIAAFIGEDEVARVGIAYWEENHFYGAAGEIAARIGDIEIARQMISACEKDGQQYQVGRIAALLDDKSLARKKVSSLQKEGQHGLASYIAAFIGDDEVAARGVKGETSALAGEVFAMLSQSKKTTEIMNSLDDQGFYHTAGRLAAIIGDEKSVKREIQNIQTSDDLTEKVVQQREGEAAYVAAEALWWKKWRKERGSSTNTS